MEEESQQQGEGASKDQTQPSMYENDIMKMLER